MHSYLNELQEQKGRDVSWNEITQFPLISIVNNPYKYSHRQERQRYTFCLQIVATVITSNHVKTASFNIFCVQEDSHGTAQQPGGSGHGWWHANEQAIIQNVCSNKRRLDVTQVLSDVTVSVSSHSSVLTPNIDI